MNSKPLPIIEPHLGQVVSGFVVTNFEGPLGEDCIAVASNGVCCAYRVDPAVRVNPFDAVELHAVALEKQDVPAWEVYFRREGCALQLMPDQHCAPRTVPAEQWLKEIQTEILPELFSEAERIRSERTAQEATWRAINPAGQPELVHVTALANARKELLGCDYARVCRAAEAAKHRSAKAAAALRRQQHVGEGTIVSRPEPWGSILRWRKSRRLQWQTKRARTWYQRMEAERRRLERAANDPETIVRVERRAQELIKSDRSVREQLGVLEREEKRVGLMVSEAQKLLQYLQQRRGSAVTLQQTNVRGRAQTLPTIPGPNANMSVRPARLASSLANTGDTASNPRPPDQRPQATAEVLNVERTLAKHSTSNGHTKSNGFGIKM